MNERLKSELSLLYDKEGYIGGYNAALEIAQHFYSLALEDVKAKLKVVADHYNNDPRYDGGCALDELYEFIDKLSK